MNQHEVDVIVNDFNRRVDGIDETLQSATTINDIVDCAISLCTPLSKDLPIDQYIEIHSTCLSSFATMKKVMTRKMNLNTDQYSFGFRLANQSIKVIPRLYTCLLIACTSENPAQLQRIIAMLPSVAHPLRALMLRFTTITFFPRTSSLITSLAQSNFNEMLYFIPTFLAQNKNNAKDACGWLVSNISISIYMSNTNREIITQYFNAAQSIINTSSRPAALSIVETLSQSIDSQSLNFFFPNFWNIMSEAGSDNRLRGVCDRIITKVNTKEALDFIIKTSYSDDFKDILANRALEEENDKLVQRAASIWPEETVLSAVFVKYGHDRYANLCPAAPKGSALTIRQLETGDTASANSLRKIMENELTQRNDEIENALLSLMQRRTFDKEEMIILFNDPYRAQTDFELKLIVGQMGMVGVAEDFISEFAFKSNASAYTKISLMSTSNSSLSNILTLVLDEQAARILISHLNNFPKIKFSEVSKIVENCKHDSSILELCASLKSIGKDYEGVELLKNLSMKDKERGLIERFQLYFDILNVLAYYKEASGDISEEETDLTNKICCTIKNLISSSQSPLFPIASPYKIEAWKKISSKFDEICDVFTI